MILVFDIGTTAVKAGLFGPDGRVAAMASRPVSPPADAPRDPLQREADPLEWTRAVVELSLRLDAGSVKPSCIVISGNGPTLVPADAAGVPLAPAITWMDRRCVEEAAAVSAAVGYPVDPMFYLPKALWFFRRRPRVYERTAYFFSCPEFAAAWLTGERFTFLPAEGFRDYIWEEKSIRAVGMDPEKFPPFVKTGSPAGAVRREAAAASGIPVGTPVFAGGPDFIMSLLGTATTRPGRVCDRAGTSEGINLCTREPLGDPRLVDLPHPVEPLRNVSGIISNTGGAVDWFKRASGREGEDHGSYLAGLAGAPPGAARLLFLPYLAGERAPLWDSEARGVFVGLSLDHGRAEMARAVLEGTAFAMRDVIEVMESRGARVNELRVTGRPAASPLWNQVKADITGRPVLVPEVEEAELMGDACVGLRALGGFSRLDEAAEALVRMKKTYAPDPALTGMYGEAFRVYRKSYEALRDVFKDLAGAGRRRS
jgi:xylulokinase